MTTQPRGLLATDPDLLEQLRLDSRDWPSVTLDTDQLSELELLLGGALAPRGGYDRDHPLVIGHTVGAATTSQEPDASAAVEVGARVGLRDLEGALLAMLDVAVTRPIAGELVRVEGAVTGLEPPIHHDLTPLRRPAAEVAGSLDGTGAVLGLIVDRPLHPADVAVLADRMARADAALLLVEAAVGELDRWALARSLRPAVTALGSPRVHAVMLPESDWLATNLASPDWSTQLLANHGVTDVIGLDDLSPATHDKVLAGLHQIVERTDANSPPVVAVGGASGYPAAIAELRVAHRPAHQRGLVVFFTGLSGSGKSTVAQIVTARLREADPRRVTLLDGDVVRTNLSAGLGFSAADRDRNIRRIGWVAAEVAAHGGSVVACPIAPYDAARRASRAAATDAGAGFILVHVSTPLAVCEGRDRKGLYAKARAGLITGFTGIDDPYEPPTDAEVVVDTTGLTPDQAASIVLRHLESEGWTLPA